MILLIDNYDSFSYNLYQYIGSLDSDIVVIRNDEKTLEEIEEIKPDAIVISPGPGRPEQAGICIEVVRYFKGKIPILGVCLGHQAICQAYGATITYAKELMHGKQSVLTVDQSSRIFKGLEKELKVARYHSLAADENTMPECLEVIARADDGEIMAVKHKECETYGLQFHPESVLTPDGMQMIENFLGGR
ncbi:MAG: aminodeoxychorismate/anthranilate synthase component II [Lachnospiraceae bacterium]|nr:aminodeoxychorismate/anthranilate synthase component II [Lachnospiraceae bacterium]